MLCFIAQFWNLVGQTLHYPGFLPTLLEVWFLCWDNYLYSCFCGCTANSFPSPLALHQVCMNSASHFSAGTRMYLYDATSPLDKKKSEICTLILRVSTSWWVSHVGLSGLQVWRYKIRGCTGSLQISAPSTEWGDKVIDITKVIFLKFFFQLFWMISERFRLK